MNGTASALAGPLAGPTARQAAGAATPPAPPPRLLHASELSRNKQDLEPQEHEHVERNILRMRSNPLLDREEWQRKMEAARAKWKSVTADPVMLFLAIVCVIAAILFFLAFVYAVNEFIDPKNGKRQHFNQIVYIWVPLILLTLAASYI